MDHDIEARRAKLTALQARAEAELRNLGEASAAADVALGALAEVRRQLDHVSQLQARDNLLGGAVKVSNPNWLAAVGQAAAYADRCTAMLHAELAEVGLARPLGNASSAVAPIGATGGFLERVFLSNMTARGRVSNARRSVDRSAELVEAVRRDVAARTGAARAHRDAVTGEKNALG